MQARRSRKDGLSPRMRGPVRNEKRVSRSGRMVCDARTVERPIGLRRAFQIELCLSAQRRYGPYPDLPVWAGRLAKPKQHQGAIGRESQRPDRGVAKFRNVSATQVIEPFRTRLCNPDIGMSLAAREE